MGKYEQFAKDYLKMQDEIKCTDENIEKLGAFLENIYFNIEAVAEGFEDNESYYKWRNKLDNIAEEACK